MISAEPWGRPSPVRWLVMRVIFIVFLALCFTSGCAKSSAPSGRSAPEPTCPPIPVGEHAGLGPVDIPFGEIGPESEFRFMVLTFSGEPTGEVWCGFPTDSTEWSLDGVNVDVDTVAERLESAPPDLIDVEVLEPGVLSAVNIRIAEQFR